MELVFSVEGDDLWLSRVPDAPVGKTQSETLRYEREVGNI